MPTDTPEALEGRARDLSGGYLVHTQGKRAAAMYRQAAEAYQRRGNPHDAYRANRCLNNAIWCERNDVTA